jgi:pyridoxamine 5'-phosphate oxidase
MKHNLYHIRNEYTQRSLSKKEVYSDPFKQLRLWLDEALETKVLEPTAMILSTANSQGRVTSRTVLLKDLQETGLIFYTNYNSLKAGQINENPRTAALFLWVELERQVRVEGLAETISSEESDRYFESRPDSSKIGAWASDQSKAIPDRKYLEKKQSGIEKQYMHKKIPRPPHWGGYRIIPDRFEFWQGRKSRLHDRIEYVYGEFGWTIKRLAP